MAGSIHNNFQHPTPTIATRVPRALKVSLEERAEGAGKALAAYLHPWIEAAAGLDPTPQALVERIKQEARERHGRGSSTGGAARAAPALDAPPDPQHKTPPPTSPAAPAVDDPHPVLSSLSALVSACVASGTPSALEHLRELGREVEDGIDVVNRRLRPGRAVEIRAEVLRLVTERQREAGALLGLVHVRGAGAAEVAGVTRAMVHEGVIAEHVRQHPAPEGSGEAPCLASVAYRLPPALRLVASRGKRVEPQVPAPPPSGTRRDLLAGLPILPAGWTRGAAPYDADPPSPRQLLDVLVRHVPTTPEGVLAHLEPWPRGVPELAALWPWVPAVWILKVSLALEEVGAIRMRAGKCETTPEGLVCAGLSAEDLQRTLPDEILPEPMIAQRPSMVERVIVLDEGADLGGGDGLAEERPAPSRSASKRKKKKRKS